MTPDGQINDQPQPKHEPPKVHVFDSEPLECGIFDRHNDPEVRDAWIKHATTGDFQNRQLKMIGQDRKYDLYHSKDDIEHGQQQFIRQKRYGSVPVDRHLSVYLKPEASSLKVFR